MGGEITEQIAQTGSRLTPYRADYLRSSSASGVKLRMKIIECVIAVRK